MYSTSTVSPRSARRKETRSKVAIETITVEEFADMAGIGRSLAYQLAGDNNLGPQVLRFGTRMVISRRAADVYLHGQYASISA